MGRNAMFVKAGKRLNTMIKKVKKDIEKSKKPAKPIKKRRKTQVRLNPKQIKALRRDYYRRNKTGVKVYELAKDYKISQPTLYKHVTP